MNKKILLGFMAVILVLAAFPAPAWAAPPSNVSIEVLRTILTPGEFFTASGPVVDNGLVCASGTTELLSFEAHATKNHKIRIWQMLKRFNCDDLSGTFDVKVVIRFDLNTRETTGKWNVSAGTGAYADLRGSGSFNQTQVGLTFKEGYDGRVH